MISNLSVGSDVTIHGTTYNGVAGIRYVKNGATKEVSKLILNGNSVWTSSGGTTPVEPVLPEKKSFSEMTWADIQTVCKAGKASEYWSIGDTKVISNDGTRSVCIIGFDHDTPADTAAYGRSKAGITVETVSCYATGISMNSTSSTTGGWKQCSARQNFFTQLPNALGLEQYIVPVIKLCSTGGSSGSTIEKVTDAVFVLSEVEVHGQTAYSLAGEGEEYEWYMDNSNLKTPEGASDNVIRWTRSPYMGRYYACVTSTGGSYYYAANKTEYFSFAFCV